MSGKKGKSRGKSSGGGGIMKSIGGFLISLAMIGIVLAILSALGIFSATDSLKVAKDKAVEYSKCIPDGTCGVETIIDDIFKGGLNEVDVKIDELIIGDGDLGGQNSENQGNQESPSPNTIEIKSQEGYRGPENGDPYVAPSGLLVKESSVEKLNSLEVVDDSKDVGYERKEWKHWSSVGDKSCWNTREDVLKRDAIPGTLKLIDNSKNAVKSDKDACAIGIPKEKDGKVTIETEGSGEWIDPYSGDKIKDSSKLDIDHIIPLSKAARSGGQSWDEATKEKFANDPENLLAVSAKENRSKGDKGPGEYMPSNKKYHCQYAKSYVSIASKYKLTINEKDSKVLKSTLEACSI